MKFQWNNKYTRWGLTAFGVIAASFIFYFGLFRMNAIIGALKELSAILAPIIYAAVISYILWPLIRFAEEKLIYPFFKWRKWVASDRIRKMIRMICIMTALFLSILLIYTLLSMLIPEIVNSIINIADNFPRYLRNAEKWISDLLKNYPELEDGYATVVVPLFSKTETWLTSDVLPRLNDILKNLSTGLFGALGLLFDIILGAMISIYLLFGKEQYVAKGKMMLYTVFSPTTTNNIIRDLQYVDHTFGGFIVGKVLDSLIIGLLCYLGMTILNLPYSLLISVIVGITNVIPFFGPYIGAVPSAILILLVNPIQSLYFIIFILVLQQFDGNFLGPKILGDSTGLSSFMVIFAILVGGGMFGVVGMFIGVPVCAVVCTILGNAIRRKLRQKNLPDTSSNYLGVDHLDENTLKPVYTPAKEIDHQDYFSSYGKNQKSQRKQIQNAGNIIAQTAKSLAENKKDTNDNNGE